VNYYDIRAIEHERTAIRKAKKEGKISTCKNNENFIEKIDSKFIYFKTKRTKADKAGNKVPRQLIRKAISYLLYKRSVTRNELEQFNSFNSFIMGFLRFALVEIRKVARLRKIANNVHQLIMNGLKFYFAGMCRDPYLMHMVNEYSEAPGNNVLMSYWNLRSDKHENWLRNARRYKCSVLLDSGEFSYFKARKKLRKEQRLIATLVEGSKAWRVQEKVVLEQAEKTIPISIVEYARFIQRHKDVLFGYFNLDVVGDPVRSKLNANYLRYKGLNPIEIWHPQSGFQALHELVSEAKVNGDLLAIGGLVFMEEEERNRVLDEVFALFPDQPFHTLGCSSTALYRYPIFSSDSTGPIMGRRYNSLITESGQVKADEEHAWHDWTEDEALVFNIKQLSSLEEAYDGLQVHMVTPPEIHTGVQLTLF
jgi:hypothetical protein